MAQRLKLLICSSKDINKINQGKHAETAERNDVCYRDPGIGTKINAMQAKHSEWNRKSKDRSNRSFVFTRNFGRIFWNGRS